MLFEIHLLYFLFKFLQVELYKQRDGQSSITGHTQDAEHMVGVPKNIDLLFHILLFFLFVSNIKVLQHSVDSIKNNSGVSNMENSLKDNQNEPFNMNEREALLNEVQSLRNQLLPYARGSTQEDSLLDHIRNGDIQSSDKGAEDLEKERQKWTESESRWISLTEELRLDLESNRRLAEKKEMELSLEKKCTAELDDALQRAIHGHARIVEHYAELQEKYNDLFEKHRQVTEGIAEVKKAALKAGRKGCGSAFAAALSAELSTLRIDREKERAYLKEQNRRLRIQLRDTAEAVQAAGELLVRLREAEEAISRAEVIF